MSNPSKTFLNVILKKITNWNWVLLVKEAANFWRVAVEGVKGGRWEETNDGADEKDAKYDLLLHVDLIVGEIVDEDGEEGECAYEMGPNVACLGVNAKDGVKTGPDRRQWGPVAPMQELVIFEPVRKLVVGHGLIIYSFKKSQMTEFYSNIKEMTLKWSLNHCHKKLEFQRITHTLAKVIYSLG